MPSVTLHGFVESTIVQYGDREAVRMAEGTVPSRLTYQQLAAASQKVRDVLQQLGVTSEVVAVALKPSLYHAAVLLGVMSVPAAFLPLEENVPVNKLIHLVKTLNIRVLVVETELKKNIEQKLSDYMLRSQSLDGLHLTVMYLEHMEHRAWDTPLAYVITTSGTTGPPKVVRVPHECIVPNIQHIRSLFDIGNKDVVFQASPLTFDPSVVEIFCALSSGACLLVVPEAMKHKGNQLADCLMDNAVTVLQATPTLVRRLIRRSGGGLLGPQSPLRILALGGEPCPKRSVMSTWKHPDNRTAMFNLYGITEVSCWATYCRVDVHYRATADEVPLGEPLSDTVLDVRDEEGQSIESGLGQLHIGGRCCLLNSESSVESATMRNSGDVILKDVTGTLWYRGRNDEQVKRYGKRLNLAEIEQTVQGHRDVEQASCQLKGDVLWLVCQTQEARQVLVPGLRDLLQRHYPSHYQPDRVLCTPQAFPVTKHGKVDKAAVLELALAEYKQSSHRAEHNVGRLLHSLLSTSLNLPTDHPPPMGSKFLELGGTSLLAVELMRQLQDVLKLEAPTLLEVLLTQSLSQVEDYLSLCLATERSVPSTSQMVHTGASLETTGVSQLHTQLNQTSQSSIAKSVNNDSDASINVAVSSSEPVDCTKDTQGASLKRRGSSSSVEVQAKKKPAVERYSVDTGVDSQLSLANSPPGHAELPASGGATNLKDYYCKYCQQIHSSRIAVSLRRGCQRLVHRIKLEKRNWRAALFMMGNEMVMSGRMGPSGRLGGDIATHKDTEVVARPDAPLDVSEESGDSMEDDFDILSSPADKKTDRLHHKPPHSSPHKANNDNVVSDGKGSTAEDRTTTFAIAVQDGTSAGDPPLTTIASSTGQEPEKVVQKDCDLLSIPDSSQMTSSQGYSAKNDEALNGAESVLHGTSNITNGGDKVVRVPVTGQNAYELLSVWRYNTGKCVDASPTLLLLKNLGLVFIGSHSHEIAALHLESGMCLWVQTLPDRIESSAAISKCTTKIIVGCYDGSVYILDRFCGAIVWTVATGGAVKSSPTVDSVTGFVYVGSHDHHVYALAVQDCEVLWRRELDEGSVFSSPAVCGQPHLIYAATLRGTLAALQPLSGSVVWQKSVGAPVFSSPATWEKGVCVGCVDGTLRAYTHQGAKLWQYATGGSVFSSPCLWKSRPLKCTVVVVGCHSNQVHCLSTRGQLLWSYPCTAPVYASPYVFKLPRPQECSNTMCKKPASNGPGLSALDLSTKSASTALQASVSPDHPTRQSLGDYNEDEEPQAWPGPSDPEASLGSFSISSSVQEDQPVTRLRSLSTSEETGASAIPLPGSTGATSQELVTVCSTDGIVHVLRLDSGVNLGQHALPGEVFSSPVCHQRKMVIGCRDDYVYCLQLSHERA